MVKHRWWGEMSENLHSEAHVSESWDQWLAGSMGPLYWEQEGVYCSYFNEYSSVVWLQERVHYTRARKELGKRCQIRTRRHFIAVKISVRVHEEASSGEVPIDVTPTKIKKTWCWSWENWRCNSERGACSPHNCKCVTLLSYARLCRVRKLVCSFAISKTCVAEHLHVRPSSPLAIPKHGLTGYPQSGHVQTVCRNVNGFQKEDTALSFLSA
jgi:hypothetical protein